jgi:hypothetical protein
MRTLLMAGWLAAAASGTELRITVYDQAHLSQEVRHTVFRDISDILRSAGIEATLTDGDPSAAEASLITLAQPPRPGLERQAMCRARRDIALEIMAVGPAVRKETILGIAEPLAKEGLNARVFVDRIGDEANRWNIPEQVVLAHAIVHEIGHVLLRSSGHAGSGIMGRTWGQQEYGWMRRGLMQFTGEQSRRMRAAVDGVGCPVESARSMK